MRSISVVLALAACADLGHDGSSSQGASSRVSSDFEANNVASLRGAVPVDRAAWETTVGARLAAANHAPAPIAEGSWLATLPESGAWAAFGAAGARFYAAEGESSGFELGLAAWGRASTLETVEPAPAESGVPIAQAVDAAGTDLAVVAFEHAGLSEWWTGAAEGFEHGWHVTERPLGQGELVFELQLEGAIARPAGANVELIGDAGDVWLYSGLVVTDAHGEPLPAWFDVNDGGFVVVVDDAGATYPIDVDPILSTASVTLTGPSSYSYFGVAVAAAGDVNGDGFDDLIVGAPGATLSKGAAYVFHGGASGFSTTANATIAGGSTYWDQCGSVVAGGGDISNDGFDDVVVNCDGSGINTVYMGSASGVSTTAATTLTASSSNELGHGLSLEGDVNADGFADLVIGAPAHSSSKGVIYIYLGGASGLSSSASSIEGPKNASRFGQVVSTAGDVNDDGYDDVVVGAPSYSFGIYSHAGRLTVYHGSSSGLSSTAAFTAQGAQNGAYVSYALDGRGDVNGDGIDDILVGRDIAIGAASVYYGSTSGLTSSSVTTLTSTGSSHFGGSVAMLPDVDSDGDDEIAVGATGSSFVEVHAGSSSGVSATVLTTLTGGTGTYAVSLAGLDANGDGYGDLVVGESVDSAQQGKVYLHYGYVDSDGDGFTAGGTGIGADCDDDDATIYPGAAETPADGIDQDCDNSEKCYIDADNDGSLDGSGVLQKSDDGDCDDPNEGVEGDPTDDCDDTDAMTYTGATEIAGNEVDNDCNGGEVCFDDDDDDGFLDSANDTRVSTDTDCQDANEGSNSTPTSDCNDFSVTTYPGAVETTGDGIDSDCNSGEVCFADGDGDGYRTGSTVASIDADCLDAGEAQSTTPADDCDDTNATRNPGSREQVGTEIDEDCDGSEICYADADGDGAYDDDSSVVSKDEDCDDSGEGSGVGGDCNDGDSGVYPGAVESIGDEVDSNCDDQEICWLDADDDGVRGVEFVVSSDVDCVDEFENVDGDPAGDCDDDNPAAFPGGTEIEADGVDGDCDGMELCFVDGDGDGYRAANTVLSVDADCTDTGEAASDALLDCNDMNAAINAGRAEIVGDQIDSDCDGTELCTTDTDGDGYQSEGSSVVSVDTDCTDKGEGLATDPDGDCNDNDATINPGTVEITADEVDQDCDGSELCYLDEDDDGVRTGGTVASDDALCDATGEASASVASGDCDDLDAAVFPGALEGVGDLVDQDCDGREWCYVDFDEDGVRIDETDISADDTCDGVGLATADAESGDCNDLDASVFPGAIDATGDSIDHDCDGLELCFVDADGDGWRPDEAATVASTDIDCEDAGEASAGMGFGDCDDADATYNPGASETECADSNDYNCDGSTGYADADGDGWAACDECDDQDAARFPTAVETVGDGIDQDCDGLEICFVDVDGDEHRTLAGETVVSDDEDCADETEAESILPADDCDDANAARHPLAFEIVGDEVDGDCDGLENCYVDADADGWRDLDDSTMSSEDADCGDAGEAITAVPAGDCNDLDSAYNPGAVEADCTDPNDYNCDGSVGRVDVDADGFSACEECDDSASAVNPDALEVCNGVDDDCDEIVDLDGADILTFYADVDVDGYGDPNVALQACERPDGWVVDGTDCDDTTSTINPVAREVVDDGIDQDCDGFDKESEPDTGDSGSVDTGDTGPTDTADSGTDSGTVDTGVEDTGPDDTGTTDSDSGNTDIVPDDTADVERVGGLFGGVSCNAGAPASGVGTVVLALSALLSRRLRSAR